MVACLPRPVDVTLTGKVRHRVGFRNRLILQVEIQYFTQTTPYSPKTGPIYFWRDAKAEDLASTALQTLREKGKDVSARTDAQ